MRTMLLFGASAVTTALALAPTVSQATYRMISGAAFVATWNNPNMEVTADGQLFSNEDLNGNAVLAVTNDSALTTMNGNASAYVYFYNGNRTTTKHGYVAACAHDPTALYATCGPSTTVTMSSLSYGAGLPSTSVWANQLFPYLNISMENAVGVTGALIVTP